MALALAADVGQGAGGRAARGRARVPVGHLRPALPADDRARLRTRARPAPTRSAHAGPAAAGGARDACVAAGRGGRRAGVGSALADAGPARADGAPDPRRRPARCHRNPATLAAGAVRASLAPRGVHGRVQRVRCRSSWRGGRAAHQRRLRCRAATRTRAAARFRVVRADVAVQERADRAARVAGARRVRRVSRRPVPAHRRRATRPARVAAALRMAARPVFLR